MTRISKIRSLWVPVLLAVVAMSGTVACSEAGGKGLVKARDAAFDYIEEASMEPDTAQADEIQPEQPEMSQRNVGTGLALQGSTSGSLSKYYRDPFGLIPHDWPEDVHIHPKGMVCQSRNLASEGYFLMVLIPSDQATLPGVQTFHIDDLSNWESIELEETGPGDSDDLGLLTIIAERSGAWLKITAEETRPGDLETLENFEYWKQTVGASPLVIRFYYAPINYPF